MGDDIGVLTMTGAICPLGVTCVAIMDGPRTEPATGVLGVIRKLWSAGFKAPGVTGVVGTCCNGGWAGSMAMGAAGG